MLITVDRVLSDKLLVDTKAFVDVVTMGLRSLVMAEKEITKYDSIVGDGDCGTGLRRGAEGVYHALLKNDKSTNQKTGSTAVLELLQSSILDEDTAVTMQKVAEAIERSMDGTSGAIYWLVKIIGNEFTS